MKSRILEPKRALAILALLQLFWAVGHFELDSAVWSHGLEYSLPPDFWFWTFVTLGVYLASALVAGIVVALCARAVGYEAIRSLVKLPQARLYGFFPFVILWIAVTGLTWSAYLHNQVAVAAWLVVTGAANTLFIAAWLVLAGRAAASVEEFKTAAIFFGSALGSFFGSIGALLLLIMLLEHTNPQPTLPLIGLILLVQMCRSAIAPVLFILASAAMWAGVLRLIGRRGPKNGE
jgi:hypothetical protein